MSDVVATKSHTRVEVTRVEGEDVVLALHDSAYAIRLRWAGDDAPSTGVVTGRIQVRALRLHGSSAGGRFIEPVAGAPRIVSGTVEAIDAGSATIALRSVVQMQVALERREDLALCHVGGLVNFHVRSDGEFCPDT